MRSAIFGTMDKKPQSIPQKGRPVAEILSEMKRKKEGDAKWREGRTWSMVYHVDEAHLDLLKQASNLFFSESYINPFAFESLQQMELDVIRMAGSLLHGGGRVVGTMASGGTESIFLALYTYREWARKERGINSGGEVVLPTSAHPAFEKAAHILGLRIKKASVNDKLQADISQMERLISGRTLLLVASAPSYPHGILDPIPEASALAEKHGLPLHVDACIGGFMLPWVERLQPGNLPAWDFRLPGVTSISADTHKFGYGAKGSSVLLYRNMGLLRHQFFVTTDWPGGIYASSTLLGSRSGGPIATAWAAMQSLGEEGYLEIAGNILKGAAQLRQGLEAIPEIRILGAPCMNIIAFTTHRNKPDIFVIAGQLQEKGWYVDRQQRPNCIHLTIMQQNLPVLEEYLNDLKSAIAFANSNPRAKAEGNAALYGLMARLPFRGMVENNVRQLFEQLYGQERPQSGEGQPIEAQSIPAPPSWMGWLNRLLSIFRK